MRRTAQRILGAGAIALVLALMPLAGDAAGVEGDGLTVPALPRTGSPPASAEPAGASAEDRPSLGGAVELIVLAVACSVAVALYSGTAGERRRTRVPARVRRR
jgi:hypothetical protein